MDEKTNLALGEFIFKLAKGNIDALENIYLIMATLLKITEEIKGVFLCAIYLFRLSILTKTAT